MISIDYKPTKGICKSCGKKFVRSFPGQMYCYDPCLPMRIAGKEEQIATRPINRDCLMCKDTAKGPVCTGLNALYCAVEECKFYKPEGIGNAEP